MSRNSIPSVILGAQLRAGDKAAFRRVIRTIRGLRVQAAASALDVPVRTLQRWIADHEQLQGLLSDGRACPSRRELSPDAT